MPRRLLSVCAPAARPAFTVFVVPTLFYMDALRRRRIRERKNAEQG